MCHPVQHHITLVRFAMRLRQERDKMEVLGTNHLILFLILPRFHYARTWTWTWKYKSGTLSGNFATALHGKLKARSRVFTWDMVANWQRLPARLDCSAEYDVQMEGPIHTMGKPNREVVGGYAKNPARFFLDPGLLVAARTVCIFGVRRIYLA